MSRYSECLNTLEKEASSKGYLTFDDVIDAAVDFELSSVETDKLNEQLLLNGITISDELPLENGSRSNDYSKLDYDLIYNEIVSIDSGLKYLVNQIRNMPTPQKGEIDELYAKMEYYNFEGDQAEAARERLIFMHMRIVLKIALSLFKQFDYDLSDAISVGMIGLVSAVDKYDPKQDENNYFGSYATQFIWGVILRDCQLKWIHKIPPHIMDKLLAIIRAFKDYYGISAELEMPDDDFLTDCSIQTGESAEQIKIYFTMILNEMHWLSVEEYIENEDEYPAEYSLILDHISAWDDEIYRSQIKAKLHNALSALPERHVKVIKLRYGFDNGAVLTLDEIGRKIDLTRERVRQIEAKALKQLRNSSEIRKLNYELNVSKASVAATIRKDEKKVSYNFRRMRADIINAINSICSLFPDSVDEMEVIKNVSNEKLLRIAPQYGINPENYVIYITQCS